MMIDIQNFISNIENGHFFKENFDKLTTSSGLHQLFISSIITGVIFAISTSKKKSGGVFSLLWLFISGFICTGLAHALLQVFTGIPCHLLSL